MSPPHFVYICLAIVYLSCSTAQDQNTSLPNNFSEHTQDDPATTKVMMKPQRRNDKYNQVKFVYEDEEPETTTTLNKSDDQKNERSDRQYLRTRQQSNKSRKRHSRRPSTRRANPTKTNRRKSAIQKVTAETTMRISTIQRRTAQRSHEKSSHNSDIFGVFDRVPLVDLDANFGAKTNDVSLVHHPGPPYFGSDTAYFDERDAIAKSDLKPQSFQNSHLSNHVITTTSPFQRKRFPSGGGKIYPWIDDHFRAADEIPFLEGKKNPYYDIPALDYGKQKFPEYSYAQNVAKEYPNHLSHPPTYQKHHQKLLTVTNTEYKKVKF